jgi:LPXTG-motif cell wall-anchored protein
MRPLARAGILGTTLGLLVAVPALGAMNASVEPVSGPPGQMVTLETVGVAGAYDAIASSGDISVFLVAPGITDAAVCNTVHAHEVGLLTWTGGVGRLSFSIPALAAGSYSFRALVPDSGCWIIGDSRSTLALRIDAAPTGSNEIWLLAFAIVFAAGIGLVVIRRRRPRMA